MYPVNEFEATIHSLGEHVVDTLGRDNLDQVLVSADELTETAEITISLRRPTWAEQSRAIDRMVELRLLFMDDLSFDYRFVDTGDVTHASTTKAAQLSFA